MNQSLVDNWNLTVTTNDLVFILGDFSLHLAYEFIPKLNGTKVFIRGNHDKRWEISSLQIISGDTHIFMQHSPYLKEVPLHTNLILCGHVHDKWKGRLWNALPMINVSVDAWDYKPVSLDTIKSYTLTLPSEALPLAL